MSHVFPPFAEPASQQDARESTPIRTPSVYPVSLAELDHALRVANLSAQLGLMYMTRADKLGQQAKLRRA